ncbi:MAG: hypothetical protein HYU02_06565 [Thaumarchaeota archaeon]|nr:hypothetical protein [Nitrososphaerota archaeon]
MRDTSLTSDLIRFVAMIMFLLGLVGVVTGAVVSYQQPPSPIAMPTLIGASITALIGTILVILINTGIIGE